VPFGDILNIQLATGNPELAQFNKQQENHKGFAFIEFESPEDAKDAIENMHKSELLGKVIKVSVAHTGKYEELQRKASKFSISLFEKGFIQGLFFSMGRRVVCVAAG
jgi:RNA recognition motif-containing protein